MKLIFILFLIFPLTKTKTYERVFSLRPDQKPSEGGGIKKTLKKLTKLKEVPTIPPIPTLVPRKIIVDPQNLDFDPCKTVDLCQNNGVCIKEGNSFYCECRSEYYGKTCEFFASQVSCVNHRCRNGGTCYSVEKPQIVINPDITDMNAVSPDSVNPGIVDLVQNKEQEALKNFTIVVNYQWN
ncbi:hypothetical protein FO519_008825 [Halicephalobus sp. NKZ332]|nr:hypothetical protein FO519_008825 [Halicephalobus sp. NKZ332]